MASIISHPAMQGATQTGIRTIPCIESSFIQEFKYDPSTFQLTVTMKNGAQYLHFYVYPMTIDQLIQSPSKGSFYGKMIKGKNPGTRIIDKKVGPQVRNPLKGPVHHADQRNQRRPSTAAH